MSEEKDEELEKIKKLKIRELLKKSVKSKEIDKSKSPGGVVELSKEMFGDFVSKNNMAVIDCWAPWCGPCRFLSPIIEEIAEKHDDKIAFGKLNVDNNSDISRNYRIQSIPTLLIFKKGKLVDQIIGAMPRKILEPKILSYLQNE